MLPAWQTSLPVMESPNRPDRPDSICDGIIRAVVPAFFLFILVVMLTLLITASNLAEDSSAGPTPVGDDPVMVEYILYPLPAGGNSTDGSLQYLRPAPVNDTPDITTQNWSLKSGLASPLDLFDNFSLSLHVENPHNETAPLEFRLRSGSGIILARAEFNLSALDTRHGWEVPLSGDPPVLFSDTLVLELRSDLPVNLSYRQQNDYEGAALHFTGTGPVIDGRTMTISWNGTDTPAETFYPNMPDKLRSVVISGSMEGPFFGADGGEPALRITIFNASEVAVARNYDMNYSWDNGTGPRYFRAAWDYPAGIEPGRYRMEWRVSDEVHAFDYISYFNISGHGALVSFPVENLTARFGVPSVLPFIVRNTGAFPDSFEITLGLSDSHWSAHVLYPDPEMPPGKSTAGEITLVPPYPFDESNMSARIQVDLKAVSRNDSTSWYGNTAGIGIDPLELLPDFFTGPEDIETAGNLSAGSMFTVLATIHNIGGGVGNVTVSFYTGPPGEGKIFASRQLTLKSGESSEQEAIHPGIMVGELEIFVELDAWVESDTGNNLASRVIHLPAADFEVHPSGLGFSGEDGDGAGNDNGDADDGGNGDGGGTFTAGENITISARVNNTGDADGKAKVFFYSLRTDQGQTGSTWSGPGETAPDGADILGYRNISVRAGGGVVVEVIHVFREGNYLITVVVEFGFPELDISDNSASAELEISTTPARKEHDDSSGGSPVVPMVAGTGIGAALVLLFFDESIRYRLLSILPAAPLYSRIKREDMLTSETRRRLMKHISTHPGVHFRQLMVETGLKNGALSHHLRTLERGRYIRTRRDGMYRRFCTRERVPEGEFRPHRSPREIDAMIMELLEETPGLTQAEIARRLGESRQRINNYVKRLAKAGLMELLRDGRVTRCYPPGGEKTRDNGGRVSGRR